MEIKQKLKEVIEMRNQFVGALLFCFGIIFIFFNVPIQIFTQTDINYQIFGIVLIALGVVFALRTGKRRRY